ncbi:hypothetical protein OIO90_001275 [Microbotryomycetes sp. JL221]|nr:hypothetical protein OIO90_001275 [Microbotryomycetes sp. JL221]
MASTFDSYTQDMMRHSPPFVMDNASEAVFVDEAWLQQGAAPTRTFAPQQHLQYHPHPHHHQHSAQWNNVHTMQQAFLDSAVDSSRWTHDLSASSTNPAAGLATGAAAVASGLVEFAPLSPNESQILDLAYVSQSAPTSSAFMIGHDRVPLSPQSAQASAAGPASRRLSFDVLETEPDSPSSSTPKTKPFIAKLTHLVDNPDEFRDCIVWDDTGTSFIVCHASSRLLQEVLPKFFSHSNIHSFTRQLNVYGFTRMGQAELADRLATASTGDYSGWSHPHFTRDDKSKLEQMTPKPSRARMLKKLEKQEKMAREEARRREATLLVAQSRHGYRLPHKTGAAIGSLGAPYSTHGWGLSGLTPGSF